MSKEADYPLGFIKKSRGLKGELLIALNSTDIEFEKRIRIVWLGDDPGHLHPWDVEYLRLQGNNALLKLNDINSREEAEYLKNIKVFITQTDVIVKGPIQLIGYAAYSDDNRYLGDVVDVHLGDIQQRLVISDGEKEIILPFVDEFITDVDTQNRQIRVFLPEGLEG